MRFSSSQQHQRGSVVLVALCFLAVLGIALASYLAVSHQAVKLSNREYQRSISLQLAESGIEQSLWSFSWNNWSSSDITTISNTAIRHITFPASKYNNGVLGSIMLRVDRYDATVWNNFTPYNTATHDLVWYQGVWYQCITNTSGTTPPIDSLLWISAPGPWNASANYQTKNIVIYRDGAYLCTGANINTSPTSTDGPTYWSSITASVGNWNSGTNYVPDNLVLYGGMSYRCLTANSNKAPPDPNYWVGSPTIYAEGIATPPDNPASAIRTQLRASVAPAPLFPNAIGATSTVSLTSSSIDSYNSPGVFPTAPTFSASIAGGNTAGIAVKMSGGTVDGYIDAPSGTSSPYAANVNLAGTVTGSSTGTGIDLNRVKRSPYIPQFDIATWDSNRGYQVNDIVFYGTDHYLCIAAPTAHQDPTNIAYWGKNEVILAPTADIELPPSAPYQNASIYVIQSSLNLTNTITIKGRVALFIEGDFQISGAGKIVVPPVAGYPYARAQIQFTRRLRINSSGTIDNQTSDAKKLILIGSTTFGSHTFYSSSKFYGTTYMPLATNNVTFSNPAEIFGALSAQKITFNSPVTLHYDTSLRTATFPGIDLAFMITEWRELTDPAEKIVLP